MIITLILLSVVTFMAITFLALSRRERSAVATVTDTASARLAADAALANAEAQIIANALSATNPFNFGLLVSTNYINLAGFQSGVSSFTNVNYDHLYHSSAPLSPNDFLQNLANLYFSPRPPVFIPNPTNSSLPADFRFYLDLNRNGRYDTNGWVTNLDNNLNGLGTVSFQVGDPEWIGVLQRPDQPYGPNNPFVARYAFMAVPVGNTLDLNYIYNDATRPDPTMAPGHDGFFRNQGVGSWEINLAAFLTDLNTNQWDPLANLYTYDTWSGTLYNTGAGFDDALSLLKYRYYTTYNNLAWVQNLFNASGQAAFQNNIDGYSDWRPPMTTMAGINVGSQPITWPWAGADNTNHYFTHQELFNPNESSVFFTNRLQSAGTNNSTYDRYTFYRLLSQLGTDTTPESGKMNLNYDNINPYIINVSGFPVLNTNNGVAASTNFASWQPLAFFTNAADRLLRAYTTQWRNSNPTNFAITFYAVPSYTFTNISLNTDQWTNYPTFGIGHIPVLVSNQLVYSSAVNRLLQLAANMYDATTNSYYPSVFRPTFWVTNENGNVNVYINGYQQVVSVLGIGDPQLSVPWDVATVTNGRLGSTVINYNNPYGVNVYGVPWIIGAKKGFPNFNKFSMQSVVQITRKLQIKRSKIPTTSISDFLYTNQQYTFSVSNWIGMDCWNSYTNAYLDPVQIVVQDNLAMWLTNDSTFGVPANAFYPPVINTNFTTVTSWASSEPWLPTTRTSPPKPNPYSFIMPITNAIQVMTNSVFYFGTTPPGPTYVGFWPVSMSLGWESNKWDLTFPDFGLVTSNRLQLYMLDGSHVIDYVQFAGPQSSRNLNAEIQTYGQSSGYTNMWSVGLNTHNLPYGIVSQIDVSRGSIPLNTTYWKDSQAPAEIDGFFVFMGGSPSGMPYPLNMPTATNVYQSYATNYVVQVPYPATVTTYEYTSWQANDPLVHYMTSDLNFYGPETRNGSGGPTTGINVLSLLQPSLPLAAYFYNTNANNNYLNERYSPWPWSGMSALPSGAQSDSNPTNLAYKDPLVSYSDNWNFPTNKFPGVGWLGRVHRGTPWQTVYLKATNILNWIQSGRPYATGMNTWENWTGNVDPTNAADPLYVAYTTYSMPAQDRLLFDLFTTALNDNATRGTLSVNVGPTNANLAAWSALFSGIVVPTNLVGGYTIIQPAGPATNSLLNQLVNGINQTRANTNLFPLQTFPHVGDILATPQLTEQSPFLASLPNTQINDEMYEWLPQQTMSLLRCSQSPRYVIYCYGQTLKPAPNGIYTGSGQFFGMVTNYQIVSEIATRAVVRFNSTVTNTMASSTIFTNGVNVTSWFSVPVVTNNNAVIENFNLLPPD